MKYLIPVFAFFLSGVCLAQKPEEKTLLWEVKGNGLKAPSYLYGTYHLVCPDELVVDSAIARAFNATQQLYLELNMSDPNMAVQTMQHMTMTNKKSLKDLLPKTDYDSVSVLFQQKTGIPLLLLQNAKPMVLSAMLYPALMNCKPEGWEEVFLKMAQKKNIPVKGLETVAFQMGIFDSIPYTEQAISLKESLYHFDSLREASDKVKELYLKKDLDKMQEEVMEDKDMGKYAPILLYQRNESWVPVIEEQARLKPTFIAVGAGHLGGNKGVITILRQKGYTVSPVFY